MSSEIPTVRVTKSTEHEWASVLRQSILALKDQLPLSISLYRRLQSGLFLPSSTILSSLPLVDGDVRGKIVSEEPWLIAFVDRAQRPETEMFIFGSWESSHGEVLETEQENRISVMKKFIDATRTLQKPPSIHAQAATVDMGHPDSILVGGVHERTKEILLESMGILSPNDFDGNISPAFSTIVFHPGNDTAHRSSERTPGSELPNALSWGHLERSHLAFIRSRSPYPRQDETLVKLRNVAIFDNNTNGPVAWAFIGLDGSLMSLHVETEWRRRGLARLVTRRLFEEGMSHFWEMDKQLDVEQEARVSHAHVAAGNTASEGLCQSLGGEAKWHCFWLRTSFGKS